MLDALLRIATAALMIVAVLLAVTLLVGDPRQIAVVTGAIDRIEQR